MHRFVRPTERSIEEPIARIACPNVPPMRWRPVIRPDQQQLSLEQVDGRNGIRCRFRDQHDVARPTIDRIRRHHPGVIRPRVRDEAEYVWHSPRARDGHQEDADPPAKPPPLDDVYGRTRGAREDDRGEEGETGIFPRLALGKQDELHEHERSRRDQDQQCRSRASAAEQPHEPRQREVKDRRDGREEQTHSVRGTAEPALAVHRR